MIDFDWVYGLAIGGGVEGVRYVLRCLLAEADLLMAVDGYPTLKDIVPESLRRVTVPSSKR
jgi:lactate 2-monooxygenase